MSIALFRLFVVLSFVLPLVAIAMDAMFPGLVPRALTEAAAADAGPAWIESWWSVSITVLLVAAALAGSIGMLFFKRWARSLSFWSTAFLLVYLPFIGSIVESGLAASLYEASSMLWGAALATAYFSPLRTRFGDVAAA
jgi:hypothetical protein